MHVLNASNQQSLAVIDYVHNKYKKLDYDVYGNLRISKGLYEENHKGLKNEFYADWQRLFKTSLNNVTAQDFFTNAKEGSETGTEIQLISLQQIFISSLMILIMEINGDGFKLS